MLIRQSLHYFPHNKPSNFINIHPREPIHSLITSTQKMCRASLSLADKQALDVQLSPETHKRERRRLRKIFKDLARRCSLPTPGVDELEFLKVTKLSGLLGQQFFKALDTDNDGRLCQQEFISGFTALYKGPYGEMTSILAAVLDFNHQGYVTMEETKMLLRYLPLNCQRCGRPIDRPWKLEEKVNAIFGEHAVLSFEDVVAVINTQPDFFDALYTALLNSLPEIFDEAMNNTALCKGISPPLETPLIPLRFAGHKYYFNLSRKALYYYKTQDRSRVKGIILLIDLFVVPAGVNQFELKNFNFTYIFDAANEAERDDWVNRIHIETGYRWFDDYYEAGELLGSGAYGQVLKAKDRKTGRIAAVKIISKEAMEAKCEVRIRREIDILRVINHENLLKLYDVFETNDRIYLVTEIVTGGPLFAWLEGLNFQIPEATARSLTRDIAKGLAYLHSYGIVHRDIKLENILLDTSGPEVKAKVIDYGLSCFLGPGQKTNEPVGTLKYVAPEIISRMQYREKIDCWSLGVIVFIFIQGSVPFYGKNDQEIAMRILRKKVRFDSEKWENVPLPTCQALEGLLNRKPERRLSMQELLRSEWLAYEDDDTDDTGIAVPRSLELTTPFQGKLG